MITIDNRTYRNLEEQVLKNMQDITDIRQAEKILTDFGIKVLGHLADTDELYDRYPEETYPGDFGDCFTIGDQVPYEYYVFTRTEDTSKKGIWFLIGRFPQPGPQGEKGIQGPQGPQGPQGTALLSGVGAPSSEGIEGQLYLNTNTYGLYKYANGAWNIIGNIKGAAGQQGIQGPQGATGPQGAQGPQGPRGDVGGFINIQGHVASTSELPNPSTITDRTWAFLVGNDRLLYVQVPVTPGSSTYQWLNFGELNVGTYVTVNGEFVNVYEMDNKLDKVTTASIVDQAYVKLQDGSTFMMDIASPGLADRANALARYDSNYILSTNAPTSDTHCANKKYVDDNLPTIWRG